LQVGILKSFWALALLVLLSDAAMNRTAGISQVRSNGGIEGTSSLDLRADVGPQVEKSGSTLLLIKATSSLVAGALLLSYSDGSWLQSILGIALEGLSLAWFYMVELECMMGTCFPYPALNDCTFKLLRWKVHIAVMGILTFVGLQELYILLKFWFLPLIVMQVVLSMKDGKKLTLLRSSASCVATDSRVNFLREVVRKEVGSVVCTEPSQVPSHTSLFDLGLDSAAAVRLRNSLAQKLGVDLPATFVFDFPTVNVMITTGLRQLHGLEAPMTVPTLRDRQPDSANPTLSILSEACDFPCASSLDSLWELLDGKCDAVVEVPLARWDHNEYFSPYPQSDKTTARHGAFIEDAHLFDPSVFELSKSEARTMDPQQRLLLTTAYHALVNGGHDHSSLQGADLGVFAAVSNSEWYRLSSSSPVPYTGTGVSAGIGANRVSFTFGLMGQV